MDYLHHPLSAFNKYEALKMMDSLQHLAKNTKHELLLPCLPDDTPKNPGQALNCFYCMRKATSRDGVIPGVDLNTQNNFIQEDTKLRFHSFAKIWFDYEKKKQTNVNKAIRNENTTTTTHLQDLQAPRDIVKRN